MRANLPAYVQTQSTTMPCTIWPPRNLREEATTGSSNAALRKSPDQDAVWAPLPGYRHTLAVLTGSGSGGSPSWDANALLAAAQKVLDPVGVTWYHGTEAATLGEYLTLKAVYDWCL